MIRNAFSKLKTIFTPRPSATNISPRLLELATSGNVDAQAKLAEIYFNDGGAEHYAASLHWNRQAARQERALLAELKARLELARDTWVHAREEGADRVTAGLAATNAPAADCGARGATAAR